MPTPLFPTPPIDIIDLPADARHSGGPRPLEAIRYIVVHTTEGTDSREWLSTHPHSVVSIHRLIQRTPYDPQRDYGGHYKILPDERVAYHAGSGSINHYGPNPRLDLNLNYVSLGIELERYGSQAITAYQYNQAAAMLVEWWGLYGFLPVLRHQDVDPSRRSDPVRFDWSVFWRVVRGRLALVLASSSSGA